MYSATLTFNGVAGPAQAITPSVTSLPGRIPRWVSPVLAWDGSAILLVAGYAQELFTLQPSSPDTILTTYAMLLTGEGALVAGSETALDPAFALPSAAASSGREFLLAGSELALGYRDGSRLRFTYPMRNVINADVVWGGRTFVVARLCARHGHGDAHWARRRDRRVDRSAAALRTLTYPRMQRDASSSPE